jgi:hypothetical protein
VTVSGDSASCCQPPGNGGGCDRFCGRSGEGSSGLRGRPYRLWRLTRSTRAMTATGATSSARRRRHRLVRVLTSATSMLAICDTWLLDSRLTPNASTSFSTRRVDTLGR